MHQLVKINDRLMDTLKAMFDELAEPAQVLTSDSARPLVVHQTMGQLTLVHRGRGHAALDGQVLPIEQGDLIILAPNCEHAFLCSVGELVLRHWHWPKALLDTDRRVLANAFDFGGRVAGTSGTSAR